MTSPITSRVTCECAFDRDVGILKVSWLLLLPFSLLTVAKQHGAGPFRWVSRVNFQRTLTSRPPLSGSIFPSFLLLLLSFPCFLLRPFQRMSHAMFHQHARKLFDLEICHYLVLLQLPLLWLEPHYRLNWFLSLKTMPALLPCVQQQWGPLLVWCGTSDSSVHPFRGVCVCVCVCDILNSLS